MPSQSPLAEAGWRTRVAVEVETISSNEELEARLRRTPDAYDIVCPSDYMVERLAREGRLLALDAPSLPGRASLAGWVSNPSWDPELTYSAPLAFGTTGIIYRRGELREPDSWSALFEPENGRRVGMLAEVREVIGAALIASGYDANATSPRALESAWEVLRTQAPHVLAYDSDDFVAPVVHANVSAHQAWSGPAAHAVRTDRALAYAVPREGACLWVTTASIPTHAPDPDAAHRLIAALLEPEIAAETVLAAGYATPNEAARERLPSAIRDDPSLFPDAQVLGRCQLLRDLGAATETVDALWSRLGDLVGDRLPSADPTHLS